AGRGGADPGVHPLAVAVARGDALEEPVAAVVGGVLGEAVGVRGVAAVAVEREMKVGELCGAGEGAPVNVGVDDVDVGGGVDADDGGGEADLKGLQEKESLGLAAAGGGGQRPGELVDHREPRGYGRGHTATPRSRVQCASAPAVDWDGKSGSRRAFLRQPPP